MSSYFGSATDVLSPLQFTITLTRTDPSTQYHFGYNIQQVNYLMGQVVNMSFTINGTRTATTIIGSFYTNTASRINVLKINYAVLEAVFEIYTFTLH